MKFPLFPNYSTVIDGPDLSGKSTLFKGIHKKTNFAWDMRDRSYLSVLCYAKQFKREKGWEREGFEREICNLNTRYIIVLPPLELLQERLDARGDDFQDRKSLIKLHEIYSEEVEKIKRLPNVLLIDGLSSREEMVDSCISFLSKLENLSISQIAGFIEKFSSIFPGRQVDFSLEISPSDLENISKTFTQKDLDFDHKMTKISENKFISSFTFDSIHCATDAAKVLECSLMASRTKEQKVEKIVSRFRINNLHNKSL